MSRSTAKAGSSKSRGILMFAKRRRPTTVVGHDTAENLSLEKFPSPSVCRTKLKLEDITRFVKFVMAPRLWMPLKRGMRGYGWPTV